MDRKEYFEKWLYKGLKVINFNKYKDKILLFIVKNINPVIYERKLINPVMEIYMFNLKPKSKSSAAYNRSWCKQTLRKKTKILNNLPLTSSILIVIVVESTPLQTQFLYRLLVN